MKGELRSATSADLRRTYDVTDRTIQRWNRRGVPRDEGGPGRPNRYCLSEVASWLRSEGLSTIIGATADTIEAGASPEDRAEMADLKKRKLSMEIRKLELAVQKVEGALVDRADVDRANVLRASAFKAALLTLPARLGPVLAPLDSPTDVEGALRDELVEILEDLAAKPVIVTDGDDS